jgi:D-alanyl-D-alanine carboxypeptidase
MTRILLFSFLLACGLLRAQSDLTQEMQVELQQVIDTYYQSNNLQGITAAVYLDSFGLFQGVAGFSYEQVPMDTSLLVGIASNTKLFTSILCLKLASGGYFSLEDPVTKWLNPIQYVDPDITIRQLLQHNSGVNDFIGNMELYPTQIISEPSKVWTPEETLSYIFEPITSPGQGVFYSNANYLLAAMIVEASTGSQYHNLVRDSILIPLGLSPVFFEGFEEVEGEMAHPFLFGGDFSTTSRIALGTTTWAAGCMVSKPSILTLWYDALFNGDFLTQDELFELTDFMEWPDDPEGKEMGLGVQLINMDGKKYYGHGGRTLGYSSYTLYNPECGHTVAVVINEFLSDTQALAFELIKKASTLTNTSSVHNAYPFGVRLYPNPTTDFISIDGAIGMDLYDLSGRLVFSTRQTEYISVRHLPPGTYLAKIKTRNGSVSKKILLCR